ncbi:MAG: diguanylate cyclase [Deltaproteobacteria bacterium]|nr:diguanylate cyclase [Deltaproteobacteria bacterium]
MSPAVAIVALLVYLGFLMAVALWAEHAARQGRNPGNHPLVYSLSMAIFCTAWTYYGSVGMAASAGLYFLAPYLGVTLGALAWPLVLGRMVQVKNSHRVTSLADFLSLRYGKSQAVAVAATLIALVGVTPYIGLQIRAVTTSFSLLTQTSSVSGAFGGIGIGPLAVALMILCTIALGNRRVDPTLRHQGMVVAVAVEAVGKVLILTLVGGVVTFGLFNGFGDVFSRFAQTFPHLWSGPSQTIGWPAWLSFLLLGMCSFLLLPRQFHVAVVENFDRRHIRTAAWVLPLYLVLINLFLFPMALAGLLAGYPPSQGDSFVLLLPLSQGLNFLALLAFLGGVSAATAMVVVSTTTLATMVTNHFILPLVQVLPGLAGVRRHLLSVRWAVVAGVILTAYGFEEALRETYLLAGMGLISFAAVLQFAPPLLGGLFWRDGTKAGALCGLGAGFAVWFYTMLLPTMIKSGWVGADLLHHGPWGLGFLAPERLLGLGGLDPLSNTVFWSLAANVSSYVLVSLLLRRDAEEERATQEFFGLFSPMAHSERLRGGAENIPLAGKLRRLEGILTEYFPAFGARRVVVEALDRLGLTDREVVSVTGLADLTAEVEKALAGSIGAAAAHVAMRTAKVFDPAEALVLSEVYAQMLADLNVPPQEIKGKLDYFQERETFLRREAVELTHRIQERDREISERRRAEEALKASEERHRALMEAAPDAIIVFDLEARVTFVNQAFTQVFGWELADIAGRQLPNFVPVENEPETREAVRRVLAGEKLRLFESRRQTKDGRVLDMQISSSVFLGPDGQRAGSIVILRDVTEKKRMEEALRDSEERYRYLLEAAPDAVIVYDSEGLVTYVNPAFERTYGWRREEVLGARLDFVPPHEKAKLAEILARISAGEDVVCETQRLTADRRLLDIRLQTSFLRTTDGGHLGTLVTHQDITSRKKAEEDLKRAHHELELRVEERTRDLTRAKDELEVYKEQLEELVEDRTRELTAANRKLGLVAAEQESRARELTLLHNMGDLLQACRHEKDTHQVVTSLCSELFPTDAGTMYLVHPTRTHLELAASWGPHPGPGPAPELRLEDCWALRRGKDHYVANPETGLVCPHVTPAPAWGAHLCLPLAAQGEVLGMFHLSLARAAQGEDAEHRRAADKAKLLLAERVVEHYSLALVNLRLQETLRMQSIRDPLTGLYNRRFMEETLEREIRRAKRLSHSLGVIMVDVDHFKLFNDTHGHELGDLILMRLGSFLQDGVRAEDVACRYGGEEFTLILPGAALDETLARANALHRRIGEHLRIEHQGVLLGITVSMGVAAYPANGDTYGEVLAAADAALYRAKTAGRDQVVRAGVSLKKTPRPKAIAHRRN